MWYSRILGTRDPRREAPKKGHSFPVDLTVDWWALGIMTYELLVGFTPFYIGNKNLNKMLKMIQRSKVAFPDEYRHQIKLSNECKDFII